MVCAKKFKKVLPALTVDEKKNTGGHAVKVWDPYMQIPARFCVLTKNTQKPINTRTPNINPLPPAIATSVFFSSTVTAGTTFWFLNCHIFECKSTSILQIYRKTPFRSEKHPCGAFGPTIRESKNFSSCFSLLSCCVQRAQRAEIFVFSLGFFFWNGLRTKLEALEISEISQLSLFWGGCAEYTRKKKTLYQSGHRTTRQPSQFHQTSAS